VQQKAGLGIMGFVKARLLTFGMVLVIGFLLLISLVIAAVVAALGGWLESTLGLPKFVSGLLSFALPLLVETVLFALLFRVLPDVEIEWRSVWVGAAFTAVLFEVGKWGLSFYLAKESTDSPFGAAGSVVVLLIWVNYASLILFFGAEVTAQYAKSLGHSIQPSEVAESTNVSCPGGAAPIRQGTTPQPNVPVEPGIFAGDVTPPRQPERESLTPMIARTVVPDPISAQRAAERVELGDSLSGQAEYYRRRANEHPFMEMLGALAFGLVAGLFSRLFEKKVVPLTPQQHFKAGAHDIAERGHDWAAAVAHELSQVLERVRR
jgi:hypothetical protein